MVEIVSLLYSLKSPMFTTTSKSKSDDNTDLNSNLNSLLTTSIDDDKFRKTLSVTTWGCSLKLQQQIVPAAIGNVVVWS